ncbi:predicted protein [Cyanophage PSS2]|nr:predicted protein [Cyanophage PSS2]
MPTYWAPGTLVDWQLLSVGPTLVDGFDRERVNQATYNMRLGDRVVVEAGEIIADMGRFENHDRLFLPDGLVELDISNATEERPLYIAPGQWILSEVSEVIRIPKQCEAQVLLRSSAARRGWDHAIAGYVDPGYEGRLTLEFVNCRRYRSLPVYPGLELVQLKITLLPNTPNSSYAETGRYFGDESVQTCQDGTI